MYNCLSYFNIRPKIAFIAHSICACRIATYAKFRGFARLLTSYGETKTNVEIFTEMGDYSNDPFTSAIGSTIATTIKLRNELCIHFSDFSSNFKALLDSQIVQEKASDECKESLSQSST